MEKDINLVGDVDERMLNHFLTEVQNAGSEISILNISLATDGGCLYTGFGIYDTIQFLKSQDVIVNVVVIGKCFSAGVIILQAATKRACTTNSQFLIHYGIDSTQSDTEKKHNNAVDKRMRKLISDRVKVTKRTLNTWFKQETYFNSEEALERGLIDGVIGE